MREGMSACDTIVIESTLQSNNTRVAECEAACSFNSE